MKKYIIKSLSILLFIPFLISNAHAQDQIDKSYSWKDKSEEVKLTMNVKPGTKTLTMVFEGEVSKGNLVVTALDPNGNRECGFCLITDCNLSCGKARKKGSGSNARARGKNMNSNSSSNTNNGVTTRTTSSTTTGYSYSSSSSEGDFGAKGNANEIISDPTPGEWTFVIEAIKVSGSLDINLAQKQ